MSPGAHVRLATLLAGRPVVLAPMEDVSDVVFRRLCRSYGASLCVTEFANAGALVRGCRHARRKVTLAADDDPTGIQIYGEDPELLVEAAQIAAAARPAFVDINCGCWVPRVARRGAGAGWLREPRAMVEMAARIVQAVDLPVTVKTRIGWGEEAEMPIVDLARRLEDTGVAALTIHCRTAQMGHSGGADWSWAARAQAAVRIPVIVNGDVRDGAAARRALDETGCAGVMIGRAAIERPWIFREARAALDGRPLPAEPDVAERLALYRAHLRASVQQRGEANGVGVMRRHFNAYLGVVPGALALRPQVFRAGSLAETVALLDQLAA